MLVERQSRAPRPAERRQRQAAGADGPRGAGPVAQHPPSRGHAEEGGRQGAQSARQAFWVSPRVVEEAAAEDEPVEPVGEVAVPRQDAGAAARHRGRSQQEPVAGEQAGGRGKLRRRTVEQKEPLDGEVAQRDALEDARKAQPVQARI